MKKRFIPVVLAALLAFGAVGCDNGNNNPTPTPTPVETYSVSITNKDAILGGTWSVGSEGPTLEIAVDPQANVMSLINDGTIKITSSDEKVATIAGRKIVLVDAGTAKITVACGESKDTVDITVVGYIDPIPNKPEMVTAPVSGTTYKLGLAQYGLSNPSMLYLKGSDIVSYYWQSTTEFGSAVDVVPEKIDGETSDYCWTLKVIEGSKITYIGAAADSTTEHVNDTNETSPNTKWKWDADHNTFLTNLTIEKKSDKSKPSGDYYLGTYGTYNTFSLSHAETNLGKEGSYESHLYVIPQVMIVAKTEITLLTEEFTTGKIEVSNPQGAVSFTVIEGGDYITLDQQGNVTAVAAGVAKVKVSDTKTEEVVTITVRAPEKGEVSTMPLTAAEAIEIAKQLDGEKQETSAGKYYIEDTIIDNPTTDYCNFNYSNGSDKMVVYGLWTKDGSKRYGTARDNIQPEFAAGDKVKVYGNLQNYSGTPEVKNARLQGFEHQEVALTVEAEHATVTGVPAKALNGSTVSFTVSVEEGYELTAVKVYGEVINAENNTYSFVVKGAATIQVTTVDPTAVGETKTTTAAYTGSSTGNMDGTNQASFLGVNETAISIVGTKTNNGSNNVGLNKDGTMRLYKNNTATITISITGGTIVSLKFNFGGTIGNLVVDGKTNEITANGSLIVNVDDNDVDISNGHASIQTHIKSIEITYTLD